MGSLLVLMSILAVSILVACVFASIDKQVIAPSGQDDSKGSSKARENHFRSNYATLARSFLAVAGLVYILLVFKVTGHVMAEFLQNWPK